MFSHLLIGVITATGDGRTCNVVVLFMISGDENPIGFVPDENIY